MGSLVEPGAPRLFHLPQLTPAFLTSTIRTVDTTTPDQRWWRQLTEQRMSVGYAAAKPSAQAGLTTQSRMQFHNTSDMTIRTETDE